MSGAFGRMSGEVATTVEKKGSFAGAMLPLDTWCIDGSDDWVILTVLMGKEVEDWYPCIVLQVNPRARENNSYAYARGRLSFLVCFRISLIVVFSYS